MEYYFAPMEGVAGYIYRNAFAKVFGGPDKYFAPFIAPSNNRIMAGKEIRDILPENNKGIKLIPQILANNSDYFIKAAKQIQGMGYNEINFNAGCPSGTVVSKGKGAGFLENPMEMDRFFDDIFNKLDVKISVKTRIGLESSDEFEDILKVYNKYPFTEVIVHPRTKVQMYRGVPDMAAFDHAMEMSTNKLCYNGNIYSVEDYRNIVEKYDISSVMVGRGLIANPNLVNELKGGAKVTADQLREFHDELYNSYREVIDGDTNVLFKLKEVWNYMADNFEDSHKCLKKVRKAQNRYKYEAVVEEIFGGNQQDNN